MNKEIWKDVKGYEGLYRVSNKGRVKSLRNDIILKPGDNGKGYLFVNLSKNNKTKRYYVHRLVLFAFRGKQKGKESNHKDGDKCNNFLSNLEWVTKSENGKHAYKNGLNHVYEYQKEQTSKANRGSGYGMSKLHEDDIPVIRSMKKSGMTHQSIADKFNVNRATIGYIIRGKTWTHV